MANYIDNGYDNFLRINTLVQDLGSSFDNEIITAANADSYIEDGAIGSSAVSSTVTEVEDIMGWTQSMVWSASNYNTVSWLSGVIKFSSGKTYNISSGSTGSMTNIVYVYFDSSVSTTTLQITTSSINAVGGNKILVAACQNSTSPKLAVFQAFGGKGVGVFITAQNIAANSITANEIVSNYVYTNTLNASQITAGTITSININGSIITGSIIQTGTVGANVNLTAAMIELRNGNTVTGYLSGYIGNRSKIVMEYAEFEQIYNGNGLPLSIECPNGISLTAHTSVAGNLDVSGYIKLTENIISPTAHGEIRNYASGAIDQFRGVPGDGTWVGSFDMTAV